MVKTINVAFDEKTHKELVKLKGEDVSWHDWIIKLAEEEKDIKIRKVKK